MPNYKQKSSKSSKTMFKPQDFPEDSKNNLLEFSTLSSKHDKTISFLSISSAASFSPTSTSTISTSTLKTTPCIQSIVQCQEPHPQSICIQVTSASCWEHVALMLEDLSRQIYSAIQTTQAHHLQPFANVFTPQPTSKLEPVGKKNHYYQDSSYSTLPFEAVSRNCQATPSSKPASKTHLNLNACSSFKLGPLQFKQAIENTKAYSSLVPKQATVSFFFLLLKQAVYFIFCLT